MTTSTQDRVAGEGGLSPRARDIPSTRPWYVLVLVAATVGMVSAGWQLVERIAYAQDADKASVCDINAVLSCTSVFTQWQSSALGIPNTLVSLPVFATLAATAVAGILGSRFARSYLAALLGLSLFMTAFATWYSYQTGFVMGAMCLFCTVGSACVLTAGIGVTRVAAAGRALGDGRAGRTMALLVDSKSDVIAWLGLILINAVLLYFGLAL
jgi:uncharacterized membrane protein